jgi:hypothetical protein
MSSIEVSNLCVLTAKVSQAVLMKDKSLVPVIRLQFIVTKTKVVPKLFKVKNIAGRESTTIPTSRRQNLYISKKEKEKENEKEKGKSIQNSNGKRKRSAY